METVLSAAFFDSRMRGHAPLVAVVGPTASGKSALAIDLARRFSGEIVNCDSVAVYRALDIGTAKPSPRERALVPHHMIDVADPNEDVTAGGYARQARVAIAEITQRGKLPIIVGGTGLYLRALLDGLFPGPSRSEELRERLRATAARHAPGHLHRMLRRLDAAAAARIHANDTPKLIRAIEVVSRAGSPISQMWQQGRDALTGYASLKLGLDPDRAALYTRINHRCEQMFARGLVEETRVLLEHYGQVRPLTSLGYRQALDFLGGAISREEMIAAAQQGHRNYAKRQLTWFRREPDVRWLNGFGDDMTIQVQADALLRAHLAHYGATC